MINLISELLKEWRGPGEGHSDKKYDIQSKVLDPSLNFLEKTSVYWFPRGSSIGFCLVASILGCLAILSITGFGLWFFYSPSVTAAWESIYYIEHILPAGHLIRGIHYLTSDILILITGGYLIYLVSSGIYRRMHGAVFYLWLAILGLIIFNSLSGLVLPWDQQGYWSTRIRLDIASTFPVIGPALAALLSGSEPMGHLTLTRSTVFHTGLVPPLLVATFLLVGISHFMNLRSLHRTDKLQPRTRDDILNLFALVGQYLIGTIGAIGLSGFLHMWLAGESDWGGPHVKAPADASSSYSIARPEWYFLWLFQILKYLPGGLMAIGTVFIPGFISLVVLSFPWIGKQKWGHRFNCSFGILLLFVMGGLTLKAFLQDNWDENFQNDLSQAKHEAERTIELAQKNGGIPPSGAYSLLKLDPMVQGPKLFAQNCASCHFYQGHNGQGKTSSDSQKAPDLFAFASEKWIKKLLNADHFASSQFFGGTKFKNGKMWKFLRDDLTEIDYEARAQLDDLILALSSEANLPYQDYSSDRARERIAAGQNHIEDTFGCIDCHAYMIPDEEATAIDLTGYGSKEWIVEFLNDPTHPKLYGNKNDRMPSFKTEGLLTDQEISVLADWIRNDWVGAKKPDLSFLNE